MSSSFESPTESHPLPCVACGFAFATVGETCELCAIRAACDNDDYQRAFDVADDFGISHVVVGGFIAASATYRATVKVLNERHRLVMGAVQGVTPANDVVSVEVNS